MCGCFGAGTAACCASCARSHPVECRPVDGAGTGRGGAVGLRPCPHPPSHPLALIVHHMPHSPHGPRFPSPPPPLPPAPHPPHSHPCSWPSPSPPWVLSHMPLPLPHASPPAVPSCTGPHRASGWDAAGGAARCCGRGWCCVPWGPCVVGGARAAGFKGGEKEEGKGHGSWGCLWVQGCGGQGGRGLRVGTRVGRAWCVCV